MARKSSIVSSSSIALAIFTLHVAACRAAEFDEPRTREESDYSEIESSITSGIRNLEYIRRQIIDSRNGRALTTMEDQRISDRSTYSDRATREDNDSSPRPTGSRSPRRQVDSAMYEALSKIANIQVADPNIDHSSVTGSNADQITGRGASQQAFYNPVDEEANKQFYKNFGATRTLKNEASTPKTSTTDFDGLPFSSRKFHCRPIRDIYIPKVDKRMPAYLCALGKRAFVVSSERFNQDSRDHFEISVDESTFRRMNPMSLGSTKLTSGVSVLPATLVLKRGDSGYTVRGLNKIQENSNM